jgi:hypothetical protein
LKATITAYREVTMTIWTLPVLVLLQSASPSPQPVACASAEHRQLDFWVGDWDVQRPDGKTVGRNTITREFGGCVVQEQWASLGGLRGSSFNTWQPVTGTWHQTWVDNAGTLLHLDGRRDGEAMVLEGEAPAAGGARVRHTLRLEPRPGGRVHQLWRTSEDGGKTWTVVFDGLYVRRTAPATN